MDEASPEEKLAIATKFLLSSPPGEFDVVLRDVKSVMGGSAELLGGRAEGVFRAYHTSQLASVPHPESGLPVITARANEIDARSYYDGRSDSVVIVDHLTSTATGHRPPDAAEAKAWSAGADREVRGGVEAGIAAYVGDHYSDGASAVFGHEGALHVLISATKTSPRNFWSGRWRGVWQCAMGPTVTVTGTLSIQAHYYEEGNVQLTGSQERSFAVDGGGGAAAVAEAIVAGIREQENEYQRGLEETYVNMKAIQSLRRKLPIHAEKFNWDNIAHSRLAGELKK